MSLSLASGGDRAYGGKSDSHNLKFGVVIKNAQESRNVYLAYVRMDSFGCCC